MKVAVIGGRDFDNWNLLDDTLWGFFRGRGQNDGETDITEIISGAARGADSLAAQWAKEQGVKLTEFPADWDRFGKRAGFIRNEDIVKAADFVLAFWTGKSKGTANSLSIAKRLKKPTLIIYY